jgi:hypothetical protein
MELHNVCGGVWEVEWCDCRRTVVCSAAVAGLANIRGVHSDVSASSTDGQASLLMHKGRLRSGMLRNVKVAA